MSLLARNPELPGSLITIEEVENPTPCQGCFSQIEPLGGFKFTAAGDSMERVTVTLALCDDCFDLMGQFFELVKDRD